MATPITEYTTNVSPVPRAFSWSGIFAGTFLFLAIEVTFTVLGLAIFASASTPGAAQPVSTGIHWGMGIWMVILSIIAMYFAGKLSARLSGAPSRNSGMYAGLVTFGMCIFTTVLVTAIALGSTVGGNTGIAYAGLTRVADILSTGGYWVFVALVLAMIAAASGGIHGSGSGRLRTRPEARTDERRAA